ncbi:hypothetical protein AN639_12855 [Candidatus Epulonipiscium fishelsonii]|uniref:Uncharacterized protein n=1 Tax=Candidatus Epulonipiscium fishelsonii TaxID=77094 RepID=A0ACC8XDH3_9FIRM|nr:hypothetical protein AN396_00820 [Epulopiscium sp. SCG-B11WGA-EpuloA1]ONI42180.1 hypothetical protein AN639_12855 [Epulopiscium sp. SCG-B05WGA-EpuloA1]
MDQLHFDDLTDTEIKKWEQLHITAVDNKPVEFWEEYLMKPSQQDKQWNRNLREINFEEIVKNRICREDAKPSYYPENIIQALFKDTVFKSAFGVIIKNYNPIKNTCAFINTIFEATGINKKVNEACISTSHLPQFATMEEFLSKEHILDDELPEQLTFDGFKETPKTDTSIKVKRSTIPDILLIDKEDQIVIEMQTHSHGKLWHRIIQNQSVTHALSKEKGYSIWLATKEFPDVYSNRPIMIVSNVISSVKHRKLKQKELRVDKRDTNGCAIIIDVFHPDMYKISEELALWCHFIITGENVGENIYMENIIKWSKSLREKDRRVMYKLSGTKSQLIEDGIEIGMEKGIEIGLTEGKEIGLTEGIEKGKEQKQIEIAKELLNVLDDLTISLTTKLPLAEIKKLRELHNIDRPHIDL